MKKNLFYVAMAAITMTACTAEEDLQQVKQEKTSPISFTVTTDVNADTRAEWGGGSGVTLQWTKGDLMSLFHGAKMPEVVNLEAASDLLSGMQNAIYEAKAGSSEKGLEFVTQSMVLPGQAIMVYPSDTVFDYDGNKLYVQIAEEQDAKYVLGNIPFISEGIDIAEYNDKGIDNSAGYGRNYPIRLRQVGTTMDLSPKYLNDKDVVDLVEAGTIAPITISKITLNRPTDKFNKKLPINLETATATDNSRWDAKEPGNAWNKKSVVGFENPQEADAKTNSLSFGGKGVTVAKFLLLPQLPQLDRIDAATKSETAASGLTEDASVVVETYYGTVKLTKESGEVMYNKKNAEDPEAYPKMTVHEALDEVIATTSKKEERASSAFTTEYVGRHTNQVIDVDLKKLDMSTLHIKNDKQLSDVLLVWKTLGLAPVNLTIDGDEENGEFHLSMENVKTLQSPEYAGVKLLPCQESKEKCSTIVLHNTKNATSEEIPEIVFITQKGVDVVLAEGSNWTWTGNGKQFGQNAKSMINKGTISINAKADVKDIHTGNDIMPMVNDGIININNGITQWMIGLTNKGIINIAADAELRAYDATIDNEATALDKKVFEGATAENVCGKIYNSGVLGVTAGTKGEINNYGYIMNNEGAKTYITANQTTKASFTKAFADANKIGAIELSTATDNISVSNATEQGFIKYTWNKEEAADENGAYKTPSDDVKYNYLIVEENIEFLERPKEVKFIQIAGENEVVITTKKANQANGFAETIVGERIGFILPAGCKANLKEGNTFYTKASYIKGTFYVGGYFAYNSTLITYFGGATTDTDNIVKY